MAITYYFDYTLLFMLAIVGCGLLLMGIILKKIKKESSNDFIKTLSIAILFCFAFLFMRYYKNIIYQGQIAMEVHKGLKFDDIDQIIPYESIKDIRLVEKTRKERIGRYPKTYTYYDIEIGIHPFHSINNHKKTWFEFFFKPHFYSISGKKITISCDNLSVDCKQLVELINKDRIG